MKTVVDNGIKLSIYVTDGNTIQSFEWKLNRFMEQEGWKIIHCTLLLHAGHLDGIV